MRRETKFIDIVFDGPPGHEAGRFVEVEDDQGKSIKLGEWFKRPDGYWALRFKASAAIQDAPKRKYWAGDRIYGCEDCQEGDIAPNKRAYDLSGKILCDDCAEKVIEENSQFGVGA